MQFTEGRLRLGLGLVRVRIRVSDPRWIASSAHHLVEGRPVSAVSPECGIPEIAQIVRQVSLALSTRIRFRLKTQGKRRFRKVPLWRPSSKSSVFGDRFIVYVWTEANP